MEAHPDPSRREGLLKIQSMENSSNNKTVARPSSSERVWVRPLIHIPAWLKNKYLLALTGFVVWMLFFDEKDVFSLNRHRQELQDLQQSKKYYTEQIDREKSELEKLKNNPATLEKYARETYYMKRDNEDLFLVPESNN